MIGTLYEHGSQVVGCVAGLSLFEQEIRQLDQGIHVIGHQREQPLQTLSRPATLLGDALESREHQHGLSVTGVHRDDLLKQGASAVVIPGFDGIEGVVKRLCKVDTQVSSSMGSPLSPPRSVVGSETMTSMLIEPQDTIAAIASAVGGGVGVIRLSGPSAEAILRAHFRPVPERLEPRKLIHGWWHDHEGVPLDEGLAVFMAGPRSYTGEDVVELQLHGGALSLSKSLAVCVLAGARRAEAGEFTRRAFLRGRMDLTRAQAVADIVGARTERALDAARDLLRGRLYEVAMEARDAILMIRAELEVNIDFVDEEVPLVDPEGLASRAEGLAEHLEELAATYGSGRLVRQGARVVLTGAPNAGKSSLFNALLGSDRAIVTEFAGTTRDTVEEAIDVQGIPVVLVDTAGLRETPDQIEAAGIERTQAAIATADLIVHVEDPTGPGGSAPQFEGTPWVIVASKADLHGTRVVADAIQVSARDGSGLSQLRDAIARRLGVGEMSQGALVIAHERHHEALVATARALRTAASGLMASSPPELVAVDVSDATDALASLVGLTTIEDVLDRLFSSFCIGK